MSARRWGVLLVGFGAATGAGIAMGACGNGGTGGTGGTGTGGTTTTVSSSKAHSASSTSVVTGTGGGSSGNLGNVCMADADCGTGLTCIAPTANDPVFGGGPAAGYCTASCTTDADCPGNSAVCATNNGEGICLLTCTPGPQLMFLNDPLDPNKCWGRNDLRCTTVGANDACLPTCGEDMQCPSGRVCDPRLRVCVDTPSMGKPAGSTCDPMAATPDCAGVCVTFGNNVTSCCDPCVLGGDMSDPTDTPNCGGPMEGYCVYSPQGAGAGDQGFCSSACNKQDDCQYPAFWCLAVGGLTGKGVMNGYCLGATPCPNGASDCANAMGTTCTQTVSGPFCLPPDFPLGSAGGMDGGADGGGGAGGAGSGGAGGAGPADAGADSGDGGDGGP